MNRYPLWKYLLLIVALCLGVIYALPNIYPPDPAVQISGREAAFSVTETVLNKAVKSLEAEGVSVKASELGDASALIRLNDKGDQLKAQSQVAKLLGEDYIVAVNLAPTTPDWLLSMGAGPMKLGLDLAGGVHFLLQVDTEKVLREDMLSIEDTLEKEIRSQRIRGVRITKNSYELNIVSPSDEVRQQITQILRDQFPDLEYQRSEDGEGRFLVLARLKESYIREKEDYAVKQNLTTLRKRVNEIGVSEPLVQRQGRNRIVVELPGVQDTSVAKRIIGKTANLEFRLASDASTLPSQRESYEWKKEEEQRARGNVEVLKKSIVTGKNVTNAQVGFDQDTSLPMVSITLDSDGGSKMSRATGPNIGRRMAVLFIEFRTIRNEIVDENGKPDITFTQVPDKKVINFATIQGNFGSRFQITGLDSPQEASELALLLRAGALAAPMGFVEERTIGPSLGAENIAKGVQSVQLGMILVLVLMLVYYRVFGFAANIALVINLVLIIAVMSIFGATLTLPGIAGIVLTVGMAVDANVLIFSRVREEVKAGAPPQRAIHMGYEQAFSTILDANITTFIVAIILYAIGSGPVKGFAVTLAIGILTSMFTAIVGSRAIINLIYGGRNVKKLQV
ncbi:MAG: protein translocase subunit SecD [Cellvibrionaceae bacterium]|nr:protein translocase subunit SecD [Cellvibrionaceae bacterium]